MTFLFVNLALPMRPETTEVVWTRGRNEMEAEHHAPERERDRGLEYAMALPVSNNSSGVATTPRSITMIQAPVLRRPRVMPPIYLRSR